ncbi:3',5'-cyclic-nucleotide phosphodiesterase [Methylorubrum extorquens]
MNRVIFSASLAALMLAATLPASARPRAERGNEEVRRYCTSDALTFCDGIDPGSRKMDACFKKHRAELSSGCRRAIDAYAASRRR